MRFLEIMTHNWSDYQFKLSHICKYYENLKCNFLIDKEQLTLIEPWSDWIGSSQTLNLIGLRSFKSLIGLQSFKNLIRLDSIKKVGPIRSSSIQCDLANPWFKLSWRQGCKRDDTRPNFRSLFPKKISIPISSSQFSSRPQPSLSF